jgi:hypothetical protein
MQEDDRSGREQLGDPVDEIGVAIAKRIETRRAVVPAAAGTGVLELALWRIFPESGRYPFSIADLAAASAFSLLGAALVWQIDRGRALRMVLLIYGFACLVAFVVPSALGSNITRLQFVAIPIAVLVVSLRSWRPLPVCLVVIAIAVSMEREAAQGVAPRSRCALRAALERTAGLQGSGRGGAPSKRSVRSSGGVLIAESDDLRPS